MSISDREGKLLEMLIKESTSETEPLIQIMAWLLFCLSRGYTPSNSVILDFLNHQRQQLLELDDHTGADVYESVVDYYEYLWKQAETRENN